MYTLFLSAFLMTNSPTFPKVPKPEVPKSVTREVATFPIKDWLNEKITDWGEEINE